MNFPAPASSLGRRVVAVVHEFPGIYSAEIATVLGEDLAAIDEMIERLDGLRYVRRDALGGVTSTGVWSPDEDELKRPIPAGEGVE